MERWRTERRNESASQRISEKGGPAVPQGRPTPPGPPSLEFGRVGLDHPSSWFHGTTGC